jgi:hypothetical protein
VRLRILAPSFYLRTDHIYLERLLRNLLSHALSCTSQGAVLLARGDAAITFGSRFGIAGRKLPLANTSPCRAASNTCGPNFERKGWRSLGRSASRSCSAVA